MACGYALSSDIERTHGRTNAIANVSVWPWTPARSSRAGSTQIGILAYTRAATGTPLSRMAKTSESWVDEESAWEGELAKLRVDALVAQLKDLLKREPDLASPKRLRDVGLSLSDAFSSTLTI